MILFAHVTFALLSILCAVRDAFFPTAKNNFVVNTSAFATILSGFIVATTSSLSVTKTCTSGLIYLTIIVILTFIKRKRLQTILQTEMYKVN